MTVLDTDYEGFAVIFACDNTDSPTVGQCGDIETRVLSRDRVSQ